MVIKEMIQLCRIYYPEQSVTFFFEIILLKPVALTLLVYSIEQTKAQESLMWIPTGEYIFLN